MRSTLAITETGWLLMESYGKENPPECLPCEDPTSPEIGPESDALAKAMRMMKNLLEAYGLKDFVSVLPKADKQSYCSAAWDNCW